MSDLLNNLKLSISKKNPAPVTYNMTLNINHGDIIHHVSDSFLFLAFDNNNKRFEQKYRNIINNHVSTIFSATTHNSFDIRDGIENIISHVGLVETTDENYEYVYKDKKYNFTTFFQIQYINKNTYILWNACTVEDYRNQGHFSKLFRHFISTKNETDSLFLYVKQSDLNIESILGIYKTLGFDIIGYNANDLLLQRGVPAPHAGHS